MKVLLIGGGGREHALAYAISNSPRLTRLFAAPGNAGIAEFAELVEIDVSDPDAVIGFAGAEGIDLVVIGPEAPLVAGLADALQTAGIGVFGPSAAAAQLEGSKGFTKTLCEEARIPTGEYAWLETRADAEAWLMGQAEGRLVVKADGLAAGKGVFMCETLAAARDAVGEIFSGRFGDEASVLVEEWLDGEEVSFFAISDGETALPLGSAQDHKRAFDGDTGPNTGGMGAYSPAGPMTPALEAEIMATIIAPTVAAMAARGTPFRGVLFAGLMLTADGPMLLEYNVRFGDPEAQTLAMRLQSDLLALMQSAAAGALGRHVPLWSDDAALTVVMAANGYPGAYEKGETIGGLAEAGGLPGVRIFHAGTEMRDGAIVASGGRVLNVTAVGHDIAAAQARAYAAVDLIDWPGGFCRRDIGWRALTDDKSGAR